VTCGHYGWNIQEDEGEQVESELGSRHRLGSVIIMMLTRIMMAQDNLDRSRRLRSTRRTRIATRIWVGPADSDLASSVWAEWVDWLEGRGEEETRIPILPFPQPPPSWTHLHTHTHNTPDPYTHTLTLIANSHLSVLRCDS
jgi:hypothetical protein